jgi:membrane-bound lytic murein transglycosylase F
MIEPTMSCATDPPSATRRRACTATLLAIALAVGCFHAEGDRATSPPFVETGDLAQIRAQGTLRVLLPASENRKLRRAEAPLDTERDLVEAFARQQGLEPFWIHVEDREDLIPFLLAGQGDLVAANLTATSARRQKVAFTVPLDFAREQVVTRSDDSTIEEPQDLVGRRVAARRSSSFWSTLEDLRKTHPGIEIQEVPEDVDSEEIIRRVASRAYDVTVADSNVVESAVARGADVRVACDLTEERPIAWAVRPGSRSLLSSLNLFLADSQLAQRRSAPSLGDLPAIREQRVLRVITRNSPSTYFLWRGKLMGFDYELAKRFAREQGLRLEVIVPQRNEDVSAMLLEGQGDIVTAGLTPTPQRRERGLAFSVPYNYVSQLVVGRAEETGLKELDDLAGRDVFVQAGSVHWDALEPLRAEAGFNLHAAPENLDAQEIIGLVADGTYDLTVADSHILDIELTWRDDVAATFALGDPTPMSWAVRETNPRLLAAIDEFLRREYRGTFYNVIYEKYFKDARRIRRHQEYRTRNGQLSPYDDVIRTYAEAHGLDWRLIVSQMYQESEFDPRARSFAGAVGLLQVLPRTAEPMGLSDLEDPATNIEAGVRYLAWVRDRFEDDLPFWERTWFSLAAYNAGHGHVLDARRIAAEKGLDPDVWFDNVERAMLLLSSSEYARLATHGYCRGNEPVQYVREIRSRYEAYLETLAAATPPQDVVQAGL